MGTKVIDASGGGIGKIQGFGSTPLKVLSGSFTFSASYTTGGEAFDVTEYFKQLLGVLVSPTGGYTFVYDSAAKKIKAYSAATTEVAAATNLSTLGAIPWLAWGV